MWSAGNAPPTLSAESIAEAVAAKLEPRLSALEAAILGGAVASRPVASTADAQNNPVVGGDDPWATVLKGDAHVRTMIRELRLTARKNTSTIDDGEQAAPAAADDDKNKRRARGSMMMPVGCPTISPEGRFRKVWDVFIVLLIVFCTVCVPLEVGFERGMRAAMGSGWRAYTSFNVFVDVAFILDIMVSFRTGFMVDGELVTDSRRIAAHYVRGSFVIDLLGSFPLNLFMGAALAVSNSGDAGETASSQQSPAAARLNRQLRLLRVFKLNRLLRLSKLSRKLKALEVLIRFNPSMLRVLKLTMLMLVSAYWMGCTWWLVSEYELAGSEIDDWGIVRDLSMHNAWHPSLQLLQGDLGTQVASGFFWG